MNTKSHRAEANDLYEHRHDPNLVGEATNLKPARQLNLVIPVRFRGADADAVTQAAEAAGMPVSTFIRQAAVEAAHGDPAFDRKAMVQQLDTLGQDLDELRRRAGVR